VALILEQETCELRREHRILRNILDAVSAI
jgi:hypothetical protein